MEEKILDTERLYLKKVEFIADANPIKKGLEIEFGSPITFLVGDNGVGKSTIMECIADNFGYKDDTYLKRRDMKDNVKLTVVPEKFKHKYVDFHSGDKKFASTFGEDIILQMAMQKASAGQCSIAMLNTNGLAKFDDGLVLIDEPCRGLSIKNQRAISYMIIELGLLRRCQIIVVTHSDLILNKLSGIAQYYNVGTGKDTTYEEFMKTQM